MKRNELEGAVAAAPVEDRSRRRRQRSRNEFTKHGRGKPRRVECGRHPPRNLQSHVKKNSSHKAFTLNGSPS